MDWRIKIKYCKVFCQQILHYHYKKLMPEVVPLKGSKKAFVTQKEINAMLK